MNNSTDNSGDRYIRAGEYVLGLMTREEVREFEDDLEVEPSLRAVLSEVRAMFLDLDSSLPATEAPAALWERIEASLQAQKPIDLAARRQQQRSRSRSATGSGFWQGFAAASVAAGLVAAIAYSLLGLGQPRLIVVLLNDQAQPVSIVETYGDRNVRVVPLGTIEVPAGKTLQVWTKPNEEIGPVSLGLLPMGTAESLDGPELPEPQPDQLYEITIEQAGGSPTGKPTGPIVGKGFARIPQI